MNVGPSGPNGVACTGKSATMTDFGNPEFGIQGDLLQLRGITLPGQDASRPIYGAGAALQDETHPRIVRQR
jgi:hypothetical protein